MLMKFEMGGGFVSEMGDGGLLMKFEMGGGFVCWLLGSSYVLCLLAWSLLSGQQIRLFSWKVSLLAQLLCWSGQFIGHGVFEKRAPALLDNLVQALVMGPFFVLLEALQLCGYQPCLGFRERVQRRVEADILSACRGGGVMS